MTDSNIKPKSKYSHPGQPTIFTPTIGQEICSRLADGESLMKICEDDHIPGYSTVRRWVWMVKEREPVEITKFRAEYALARQTQAETHIDRIQDKIANFEYPDDPKLANAAVQKLRLEIDTIKWQAGKQNSKFSDGYKRQLDDLLSLAGEISERLGKVKLPPPARAMPANLLPEPDSDKVKTPKVLDNDK